VTTKDVHVLSFWHEKMSACTLHYCRSVSAGEVARYVGQSTATAKRYLNRLVGEGAIASEDVIFKNGVKGTVYNAVIGGL
jgi:predicted ArsR family transcriptional regulator